MYDCHALPSVDFLKEILSTMNETLKEIRGMMKALLDGEKKIDLRYLFHKLPNLGLIMFKPAAQQC